MLDFRRGPRPRNYLSRRQQWRLLTLVMMLGLVGFLMMEARKPEHYAWLWGDPAAGIEGRPGSQDVPLGKLRRIEPGLLESVRDDAPFRTAEQDAWFELLALLQENDDATLKASSIGRVTYAQLFQQSAQYRGKLVTVRGTLRRAHRLTAPANDLGIGDYYQTWISPEDNRGNLVVVYCLGLPEGFPTGMKLAEEVEFTGFHFKRWVYMAREDVRSAPALAARTVQWFRKPEAVPERPRSRWILLWMIAAAGAFAVLVTGWAYFRTRQGGRPAAEAPADLHVLGEVEILPDVAKSLEQLSGEEETGGR